MRGLSVGCEWCVTRRGWTSCVWRGVRGALREFRTAGTWVEVPSGTTGAGDELF